jgi:hypothetical protein
MIQLERHQIRSMRRSTLAALARALLSTGLAASLLTLAFSASAAAEGTCANEALRSELSSTLLPDCRAYEMVTPPFKEGYPMYASSIAANGEKAFIYGLGDLAGASGAGESILAGDLYLDTRTPDGWKLAPVDASSSKFAGQRLVAAEADNGLTLWDQHTLDQGYAHKELWLRSPTGVFTAIGPLKPPPTTEEEPSIAMQLGAEGEDKPVGATSDYTHVVVVAADSGGYWGFDGTQRDVASVYEYSGTEKSQPILVGVNGVKESHELIGLCGTLFGGGGIEGPSSTFNALSADGETVFVTVLAERAAGECAAPTPATTEIYARIHGSVDSPAAAETVHVSANECTEACGDESGKNFEGASEDGKIAYFTSTQKLTDDATDGVASGDATGQTGSHRGCAETAPGAGGCNLYMYDFDMPGTECQVNHHCLRLIAAGEVAGVAGLAEDGARIYFVDRNVVTGEPRSSDCIAELPPAERLEEETTHEGRCRAKHGAPNLYVYDAKSEQTAFVGSLAESDESDWKREFHRSLQVAGEDGRFLLFTSRAKHLTPDDETTVQQLFEYDAATGELVRVSKGEDGYDDNGNDTSHGVVPEGDQTVSERADFKSTANDVNLNSQSIATDGQAVFFLTAAPLSPRAYSAEDECRNLYEFHAGPGGVLTQGSVHLVSDGRDVNPSKGLYCGPAFVGMDALGHNVMFTEDDSLAPSDVDNGELDIYDARFGGGFAPVTSEASCGQSCEGSTNALSPLFTAPSSATPTDSSNVPPRSPAAIIPRPPAAKPATQAQLLAKALKSCRRETNKRKRAVCERNARKRYPKSRAKSSG